MENFLEIWTFQYFSKFSWNLKLNSENQGKITQRKTTEQSTNKPLEVNFKSKKNKQILYNSNYLIFFLFIIHKTMKWMAKQINNNKKC